MAENRDKPVNSIIELLFRNGAKLILGVNEQPQLARQSLQFAMEKKKPFIIDGAQGQDYLDEPVVQWVVDTEAIMVGSVTQHIPEGMIIKPSAGARIQPV